MTEALGLRPQAAKVYRALLRRPELSRASLAEACGLTSRQVAAALKELDAGGFTRHMPGGVRLERPDIAASHQLAAQEQALLAEQERLLAARREVNDLVEQYVAGQLTQERARDVERIEGYSAVFAEVEHQFDLRPRRVSGIQRKVWEDDELEQMQPREIARLGTGMESRVIVPAATVDSPTAVRLARELAGLGEQARVMPEPPMSLMLFDERVALVPIDPSDPARGALALRNRSLVLAMTTLFELAWAQARPLIPLEGEDTTSGRDGELLALLVHGLQDEAIGRHLGISVRTVRRDIARLHVELGARSRFELGVLASRRGWV